MADHNKPTIASAYATYTSELDARLDDLTQGLDPAFVTATNLPVNSLRFSSAAAKWQRWNGTGWVDPVPTYAISISGNADTVTNGVYTNGAYNDPAWLASLAGAKVIGDITGNAGSATTLQTARTINGVSFNGSANITVNTANPVTFNGSGAGASSGVTFNGGSAITVSHNTVGAPSLTGVGASGTWAISISGNASTATTALTTVGNAGTVTNGVYTVGDQTIGGTKTFSSLVVGRNSGNTDGLHAFYGLSTGGSFANMWSRRGPYTSFINHSGSSFSPTVSTVYEYTGGYSGVYSIGHLTTGAANPGNLAIHHINSSGTASNLWQFDGADGRFISTAVRTGTIIFNDGTTQTTKPVGVGDNVQTWQTVSRAANTWYQNTTGRPIMVNLVFGSYGGGTLYVGPSPSVFGTANYTANDIRQVNAMSAIVPNGYYYFCTGGATWYELR